MTKNERTFLFWAVVGATGYAVAAATVALNVAGF
jgi:hypothetical protein